MRFLFVAALALASATAASAQLAQGPPDTHSRDLARLIGTWTCQGSTAGNTSVEVYAPAADGSITLENRVRASTGRAGVVLETFRFDPVAADWTLSAAANPFFGGLHLQAPAWTEVSWTLTGTEIVNDRPRPVRIVYTDLGALGFRREHQIQSGPAWQDDAQLTCRRDLSSPGVAATSGAKLASTEAATPPKSSPSAAAVPSPSAAPTASTAQHAAAWKFAPPAPSAAAVPSPSAAPTAGTAQHAAAWKFAPPAPRASPMPAMRDRAYDLVGEWACETIARDPGNHTYSLQSDGSLRLLNRLRLGTQMFEINEIYRFDAARQQWTNDTEHGAYRGSAPRWIADDWTFDGIATERGKPVPVRMLYKTLGPSAFRRDFQKSAGAGWATYASETCSRGGPRLP